MSNFDPYHKWLGISPQHQPPNYYRLLSLDLYESDPDVIDAAVDRTSAFLQDVATGPHAQQSQKLLNEIAVARLCLLDETQKSAYDEQLKSEAVETSRAGQEQEVTPPPIAPELAIDTGATSLPKISTDAKSGASAPPRRNQSKQTKLPASPLLILSFVSAGVLLLGAIAIALLGGDSAAERHAAEEAKARERQESFAEMGRQAESMIPDFEANFHSGESAPAQPPKKRGRRKKNN